MKATDVAALTAAGAGAWAYQAPGVLVAVTLPKMTVGYGLRVNSDKMVTVQAFCFDGTVIETAGT